MSTRPDKNTLVALSRIKRSAEWRTIETWLLARREAYVQESFNPDPVASRKAQGAVVEIDQLLKITRESE